MADICLECVNLAKSQDGHLRLYFARGWDRVKMARCMLAPHNPYSIPIETSVLSTTRGQFFLAEAFPCHL